MGCAVTIHDMTARVENGVCHASDSSCLSESELMIQKLNDDDYSFFATREFNVPVARATPEERREKKTIAENVCTVPKVRLRSGQPYQDTTIIGPA